MSASQLPTRRRSAVPVDPPPPVPPHDESATGGSPLVLGRYCLQRRLGAGAFGTVWLARDERLDRDVAIKILPRERIVGGRFEREARTAARLAHPGIVTLYEAAVDDEGAYLVSELVRGPTLNDLIRDGRLSDQDIVAIAIALCDALQHAHTQGVIHRDVKPSNVLIPDRPATPAQTAKLTDFGVALVVGGDSLTRTGDVVGTAAYMAPEQAEGLPAGAEADLYALALVIYEALTGVNPVGPGTGAQRARRLGAHLPPLRRQRRDLPRELGQGVDLALRPRPRERGGLAELRRTLVAAQAQVQDDPRVVATPLPGPPRRADPAPPSSGRTQQWESAPPSSGRTQQWESARGPSVEHPLAGEPEVAPEVAPEAVPIGSAPGEWLSRALAAGATAGLAAWLCSHVLSPPPFGGATLAALAGALTLVLPRAGWVALTAIFCLAAVIEHQVGAALVVLIGALLPVVLLPRRGSAWPLAAGAPALGLIGLAGAWPALAARAGTSWRRAALGLTGWVWLLIASPLADRVLYLSPLPGAPPPNLWTGSLHETVHHVLWPLVNAGALAPAPVWALAAVALPGMVRGRSLAGDTVRVAVWSVALVLATTLALGLTHGARSLGTPGGAVLGAVAGAAVALAPTAVKIWRDARQSAGPRAGLA